MVVGCSADCFAAKFHKEQMREPIPQTIVVMTSRYLMHIKN